MKIFVRERAKAKQGSRTHRFRVIAIQGGDITFQAPHMRKIDIETIAENVGAEVVYLREKEGAEDKADDERKAKKQGRR